MPGLNHLFQTCQTGAVAEYGHIEENIAPVALNLVSDWIRQLETAGSTQNSGSRVRRLVPLHKGFLVMPSRKNEKGTIRSVFEESSPVTRHYPALQKIALELIRFAESLRWLVFGW